MLFVTVTPNPLQPPKLYEASQQYGGKFGTFLGRSCRRDPLRRGSTQRGTGEPCTAPADVPSALLSLFLIFHLFTH